MADPYEAALKQKLIEKYRAKGIPLDDRLPYTLLYQTARLHERQGGQKIVSLIGTILGFIAVAAATFCFIQQPTTYTTFMILFGIAVILFLSGYLYKLWNQAQDQIVFWKIQRFKIANGIQ